MVIDGEGKRRWNKGQAENRTVARARWYYLANGGDEH
jgi:hypothetical protein